ncbi:MAG: hypothetical protein ACJA2S_000654 [Cyclobacteriaceae bacterium]|jgi:hypothetical protein
MKRREFVENNNLRRYVFLILLTLGIGVLNTSCNAPEEFPTTPRIELNNIVFRDIEDAPDSLVIYLDFEDGDGDLGLNRDENDYPYHDFDFVLDSNGKIVTLGATDVTPPLRQFTFLTDAEQREFNVPTPEISATDNRPPFSCDDYDFLYINENRDIFIPSGSDLTNIDLTGFSLDTLYVIKNEDRNNIFVEFLKLVGSDSNGEDTYEVIDWTRAFDLNGCGPDFNARFPIFDVQSLNSSLEGTIKYAMTSSGFNILIRTDMFKLRIKIKDRRGNDSNVLETRNLTLQDIRQP